MRSFSTLALLALPLFGTVLSEAPASTKVEQIYANAHEAFQDLLNALPEESLQAALSGLKDFKDGVFESHHRGVAHVHDSNPALATKLIVAAVQDLKKRQSPSNNGTSPNPPQTSNNAPVVVPPTESTQQQTQQQTQTQTQTQAQTSAAPEQPQQSTQQGQQPQQSTTDGAANSPAPAPAPTTTAPRPVIVPVEATITTGGRTVVQTTQVLSEVTASVEVTLVRTNAQGNTVTQTENRPAVIMTTTDSAGRTTVTTSAGNLAPTAGEVLTTTDAQGSTFLTTYTPAGGKVSSIKLITTTGADGRPSTMTSVTYVDPTAIQTGGDSPSQTTGKPGLQTGAANKNVAAGLAVVGGALALFV